jgi:hypothetical protein
MNRREAKAHVCEWIADLVDNGNDNDGLFEDQDEGDHGRIRDALVEVLTELRRRGRHRPVKPARS